MGETNMFTQRERQTLLSNEGQTFHFGGDGVDAVDGVDGVEEDGGFKPSK